MQELRAFVEPVLARGEAVALATVIATWRSAPRPVGAKMAIDAEGFAGSISGGCVEAAVLEAGRLARATGRPQSLRFGVADETAWSLGLPCGGEIAVWVERLDPAAFRMTLAALERGVAAARAVVVEGPDAVLGEGLWISEDRPEVLVSADLPPGLVAALESSARAAMLEGGAGIRARAPWPSAAASALPTDESLGLQVFVDILPPSPELVIVGAGQIAQALVPMAALLGFRTRVVDPRSAFLDPRRFPQADALDQGWADAVLAQHPPGVATAVAVLAHDPKIDDPALRAALPSRAFYVGALGSRRSQVARRARLAAAGLAPGDLDRLRGPIGLDLGAVTPEEIALAILAEITACRCGGGILAPLRAPARVAPGEGSPGSSAPAG